MINHLHQIDLKMRVVVCDDELLGRQYIARMVQEFGHELVGEAANGIEAVRVVQEQHPDVLLLDVRMPEMDGIECAHILSKMDKPPAVIFVTAFDQHAIDAFKTEAVGYLLKPVKPFELDNALQRAGKINAAQLQRLEQLHEQTSKSRKHIAAKTYKGIELVALDQVYYFLADQKYVTVRHHTGEVLLDETLKDLETEFEDRFVRIHRNALISTQYFEGIELVSTGQYRAKIRGCDDKLLISRRHLAEVKVLLDKL